MNNQQKLEKLQEIKGRLQSVNGFENTELVHSNAALAESDWTAYKIALDNARAADSFIRQDTESKLKKRERCNQLYQAAN